MGLEGAATFSNIIQQGAQVYSGIQQDKMAQRAARFQESQAILAQEEALREARQVKENLEKFRKTQKLAFLKNGVTLQGSPMLVLQETERKGLEEVDAIVKRGTAISNLLFQEAKTKRRTGRAILIGHAVKSLSTGLQALIEKRQPQRKQTLIQR
jgi:hypothetical protein